MRGSIFQMQDNRSLTKSRRLIIISTSILTIPHTIDGVFQNTIPSLLAFFLLATMMLYCIELFMVFQISDSKKSVKANYKKMSGWIIPVYSHAFFGFNALTSVTLAPLKESSARFLSGKSAIRMPAYSDGSNIEYFKHQKKSYGSLRVLFLYFMLFPVLFSGVVFS